MAVANVMAWPSLWVIIVKRPGQLDKRYECPCRMGGPSEVQKNDFGRD
jgi:hypothetical protein